MARAKKRARCRGCGTEFEPRTANQKYCSRGCGSAAKTPNGEDSPQFKTGKFTPAEKKQRAARRKSWRTMAAAAKAGDASALEVLRGEFAFAVERYAELDVMAESAPELALDRALSSAATERRLAARHLMEAEAALGRQAHEESSGSITFIFDDAAPPAKAGGAG